jgi:hypothetical protein
MTQRSGPDQVIGSPAAEIGTRCAKEGPVDGAIRASPRDCRATSRGSRHLAVGPQWIISGANDKLSLTILGKLRCAETAC